MAGETLVSSITETVYAEWINPTFQMYAGHYRNPTQFFLPLNPNNGASTVSQPSWDSNMGTPADRGAGVDTEYNATEATALTAVELTTSDSTFSVAEYGISRKLSYTAAEDTIAGDILGHIIADAARILSTAANDDGTAHFASFSGSSGTTNVALAIADLDDALFDLAERGIMGTLVGVLDHIQVRHFFNAMQATSTSMTVYAGAADRMMQASADSAQGRNDQGKAFDYKGVDYYRSGLCDTANAGVDAVGAIWVRGDEVANQPMAALGQASRRPFMIETDTDIEARVIKVVATMRWGSGILKNGAGQKLVTKAT